jgi:uncharacterized protein
MNSRIVSLLRVWALGIPLIAAACTVLPAQKDNTQFFMLTSGPASSSPDLANNLSRRELSIGLGPINFPGYLKRREVVTRVGDGRLELSNNNRWAESLDFNFQSVLSQNLGRQLNTQRIVLFPWYGRPDIDYQVEIQVHRFDTDNSNHSHVNARWIIKDGRSGRELLARESNISSTVPASDAAGSETLSKDLGNLSASIAQSLIALNEGTATAARIHNSSPAIAESTPR